ncbi:MAG: DUF3619 family protein [Burkholderiales bacterium]|nr:DUF3619 family protein [Burkholderiales bacterium]
MGNNEELRIAFQVRHHLNAGAARTPAQINERLRAARERALARQRRPAGVLAAATAAGAGWNLGWLGKLVPLLVLVLGLGAIHFWHQAEQANNIADIDMQMLADELPPNVYLDKGFGAWLTRGEPGRQD